MRHDLQALSAELNQWFQSILNLTENSLFSVAPEGPHRDAVVLDALLRNARVIYQSKLDHEGKLYTPLCFFLAAACRQLRTRLGVQHWLAAIENVSDLQNQLEKLSVESFNVGLDIGTPASLFKAEFDETVRQAGLIEGTSFLSKEDRQIALGLAINWGVRLLLAYALDVSPTLRSLGRKDLAWLAEQVRSASPEPA